MSSTELSEWMAFHSILYDEQQEADLERSVKTRAEVKKNG